ncbi:MAG: nucleotidyltransferase domain-containing protein [Methanomicrobiales archaeon]
MDKDVIIQWLQDALSSLPSLRVAYLYGSFLSRDDFEDIDIGLFIDSGPDKVHALKFVANLGTILEEALEFRHECDIKILNEEPVWFTYEVISTGMVLFTRNEDDRIEIETGVLIEYQDIKSMYDLFDREYLAQV